ncbi:uncharacterized protein LOC131251049 isoform X2 [Magnolia sinica]|uniref:uncharacterized protein LOC131251049 isoform X2 n=1 Tax=Magnolia sinica TaxID=86752 RepID=UPI002658950C|nr:uncharacterized protein LOC131251049 isoform X2 [Magnolia sinica]
MENMLRSSSSRRETMPENHQSKKIGCMSGIFRLLQNHHDNSRKRLTSGKKDKSVISPKKPKPPMVTPSDRKETKPYSPPEKPFTDGHLRRLSCDVPRSPTLPPEIRRSNSVNSPGNFRRPPALVARLMGLEEVPAASWPESAAEKRRKLLGALDKCDQDLKSLKKIIEAVQASQDRRRSPPKPVALNRLRSGGESVAAARIRGLEARGCGLRKLDGGDLTTVEKRCSEFNGEQPSPVSVLEEIYSPFKKGSDRSDKGSQCKKLKDDDLNSSFFHRMIEPLRRPSGQKGDGPFKYLSLMVKHRTSFRGSKAMIESVNEVWMEGILEERWELGRVGIVLESDIFGELIEEIVRELGFYQESSLPFEVCRKRLCF